LTAQQEQYANDPDARWSDLYKIDPERAKFDYGREKDEQKAALDMLLKNQGTDTDDVRRQLRMNADRDSLMALNPNLSADEQKVYRQRTNIYLAESEKDNPSLQQAAIDVGALIRGERGTGSTSDTSGEINGKDTGTATGSKDTVRSAIADLGEIQYKGKQADEALAEIQRKINDATDLTQDEKKLLSDEADKAYPKTSPVNVDSVVDELFKSNGPVKEAYTRYDKSLNAYNSAKSAYGANAIGAAIGNFLYSLRPEAVNEGDIELAKNSVRDGNQQAMKTLLERVGLGNLLTTDYKALATQLGEAAYNKLVKDRNDDIARIINLNSKLNKDSVGKRATIYYKSPSNLDGTGEKVRITRRKKK
jgi:hypothetical protein